MKRAIAGMALALLVCGAPYVHAADQLLEFEVASVRPAPPRKEGAPQGRVGCFGGPGSSDPVRFTCTNASISLMVLYAYDQKPYQIRPPAAEDTTRFNVSAKVAPGAIAEQVRVMLRNLLAERFKLAFHYERIEVQGYTLVVAKSGLKMTESAPDPARVPAGSGAQSSAPKQIKDADGFVYFPMRNGFAISWANGLTRWVGGGVAVDSRHEPCLTGMLSSLTGQPVIDSTGLKGKYYFTLTFGSDTVAAGSVPARVPSPLPDDGGLVPDSVGGLTMFAALEKQLGLKLERQKIVVDAFVIDHAEKTPSEN